MILVTTLVLTSIIEQKVPELWVSKILPVIVRENGAEYSVGLEGMKLRTIRYHTKSKSKASSEASIVNMKLRKVMQKYTVKDTDASISADIVDIRLGNYHKLNIKEQGSEQRVIITDFLLSSGFNKGYAYSKQNQEEYTLTANIVNFQLTDFKKHINNEG